MEKKKKEPKYRWKRDENGEIITEDIGLDFDVPVPEEVLVLKYFTCIELKPILSTLRRDPTKKIGDLFPWEVQLSLDGTARAEGNQIDHGKGWLKKYNDLRIHRKMGNKEEEFIEAVKQGRIEIEVVNLTRAEMLEKQKRHDERVANMPWGDDDYRGPSDREMREDGDIAMSDI